ncbi:hypothetical protein SAMN02745216_03707 [Desulfatibacillum alkenivorans DSM 16219]|jgi:hypothetical protein|uniref:Uncharacterized protein n=1 Tax=Desulfatibacillum alkenivorans DSM 16219 TaxID=1121393 RepID=A0A1M6TKE5_9BACT|nr:hypothetical protein SAMN02745216_03707 [Desulfatibacillum alkenivorans DSM 16219]
MFKKIKFKMAQIISVLHGATIFLIFISIHSQISQLYVGTSFSKTILKSICEIKVEVYRIIATCSYLIIYDIIIMFFITILSTFVFLKFFSYLSCSIYYVFGMLIGSLLMDFVCFVCLGQKFVYFVSLSLLSVNVHLSVGILSISIGLCYWMGLKIGLLLYSRGTFRGHNTYLS